MQGPPISNLAPLHGADLEPSPHEAGSKAVENSGGRLRSWGVTGLPDCQQLFQCSLEAERRDGAAGVTLLRAAACPKSGGFIEPIGNTLLVVFLESPLPLPRTSGEPWAPSSAGLSTGRDTRSREWDAAVREAPRPPQAGREREQGRAGWPAPPRPAPDVAAAAQEAGRCSAAERLRGGVFSPAVIQSVSGSWRGVFTVVPSLAQRCQEAPRPGETPSGAGLLSQAFVYQGPCVNPAAPQAVWGSLWQPGTLQGAAQGFPHSPPLKEPPFLKSGPLFREGVRPPFSCSLAGCPTG